MNASIPTTAGQDIPVIEADQVHKEYETGTLKVQALRGVSVRIWAGEVNLADNHTKTVYGRGHWEQLLQNMQQARFIEAIRIASDRTAIA